MSLVSKLDYTNLFTGRVGVAALDQHQSAPRSEIALNPFPYTILLAQQLRFGSGEASLVVNADDLLSQVINEGRDSIVNSRSFGCHFLIERILSEWGISLESGTIREPEQVSSGKGFQDFALLVSLLDALLDVDSTAGSNLERVSRRLYFPEPVTDVVGSVRDLLDGFNSGRLQLRHAGEALAGNHTPISRKLSFTTDFTSHYYPMPEPGANPQVQAMAEKLKAWLSQDNWDQCPVSKGFMEMISLAEFVRVNIEERVGIPWMRVNDLFSEMQILKVERGSGTYLLTTRPTMKQLMILDRLNIESPPTVIALKLAEGADLSHIVCQAAKYIQMGTQ